MVALALQMMTREQDLFLHRLLRAAETIVVAAVGVQVVGVVAVVVRVPTGNMEAATQVGVQVFLLRGNRIATHVIMYTVVIIGPTAVKGLRLAHLDRILFPTHV